MSCGNSVEGGKAAPAALQPGFSFAIAFEALHSRLALELRNKCAQSGESEVELVQGKGGAERMFLALHRQIEEMQSEVRLWRANMRELVCGYERRKREEFARLREESERQVLLARQQVACSKTLHVQELYDVFMQVQQLQQPELLAAIQTNVQLQAVVETQQQQIQDLQVSRLSLEEETARLKLALAEMEDLLASLKTEAEELIPKLHGYIDAREHLLTMTLKEKTTEQFQKLELLLRNEQRENAWMHRALKENKRKRADRLSRLQQQVADLTAALAEKDDIIGMQQTGFRLIDGFPQWRPETTMC